MVAAEALNTPAIRTLAIKAATFIGFFFIMVIKVEASQTQCLSILIKHQGTSGNLISPGNAFAEHNREPSNGR
jgi:hypothetical protein